MENIRTTPTAFIWRRVHSLTGLWLVLYLFEHLLVNSQAALWIGDDGHGFVRLVNGLESLPYLQVIEWLLIGFPLVVHGGWGIKRALSAKLNSSGGGGSKPSLPYGRNRAFSLQRITSWILLFGILGHVVQMRFLEYPKKAAIEDQEFFMVRLNADDGLETLSARLGVFLYPESRIAAKELPPVETTSSAASVQLQQNQEELAFLTQLSSFHLKDNQLIAVASSPGTAMLLMVRDQFKSPLMIALYTFFVLAAAFHAANGFWTFLIAWGVILSAPSQKMMVRISFALMLLLAFFGLAAIWGTSFVNLRS